MKTKDILNMNRKVKGGILVEFALAVPVLAIILYYASDVPRYSRYKSQMKNAAYIAASMIQNVTQNRTDKRIKKTDIGNISYTWGMSIWGSGRKWCVTNSYYPLGLCCVTYMGYIKGTGTNKAKIMWTTYCYTTSSTPTVSGYTSSGGSAASGASFFYGKNLNTEYDSVQINKDLKINNDEIKIIIELYMCFRPSYKFNASTPNWTATNATSEISTRLGFYLLPAKKSVLYTTTDLGYFNTVVIFSPRPGLFSETPPS